MTELGELTGIVGMSRDKQKPFLFCSLGWEVKYFYVMVSYFSFLLYENASKRQVARHLLCLALFCVPLRTRVSWILKEVASSVEMTTARSKL